jgi:hypothetical protein
VHACLSKFFFLPIIIIANERYITHVKPIFKGRW